MMQPGEWIKTGRRTRGWSQNELSFKSTVPVRQLARYEGGYGKPSWETIAKIARAFGEELPWSGDSGDSPTARERTYARLGIPLPSVDLVGAVAGG